MNQLVERDPERPANEKTRSDTPPDDDKRVWEPPDDDKLAWEHFCRTDCILSGYAHVIAGGLNARRNGDQPNWDKAT